EVRIGRSEVHIWDELAFRSKGPHQRSSHKEADPGSLGASKELPMDDDLMEIHELMRKQAITEIPTNTPGYVSKPKKGGG
ncbi:Hypothetical predicted protein, partial [Pelobates cultripes]